MLRQAIRKYDVKHACINDCKFDVWNHFKLNNWPTLFVVGPDGNIIQKLTEEGNVEAVEHLLLAGLDDYNRRRNAFLASGDPEQEVAELNKIPLPIELEKDKAAA